MKQLNYQDSEMMEDWEDLFDVHSVLEEANNWIDNFL